MAIEVSKGKLLPQQKSAENEKNKVKTIGDLDHTLAIERDGGHEELNLDFRESTISRPP